MASSHHLQSDNTDGDNLNIATVFQGILFRRDAKHCHSNTLDNTHLIETSTFETLPKRFTYSGQICHRFVAHWLSNEIPMFLWCARHICFFFFLSFLNFSHEKYSDFWTEFGRTLTLFILWQIYRYCEISVLFVWELNMEWRTVLCLDLNVVDAVKRKEKSRWEINDCEDIWWRHFFSGERPLGSVHFFFSLISYNHFQN